MVKGYSGGKGDRWVLERELLCCVLLYLSWLGGIGGCDVVCCSSSSSEGSGYLEGRSALS